MSKTLFRATVNGMVPLTPLEISEYHADQEAYAQSVFPNAVQAKIIEINEAWEAANKTTFTHNGFVIECDPVSRYNIDAVATTIGMTGELPAGFPGFWKALNNTKLSISNANDFRNMYASMVAQGTLNFAKAQQLKATLTSCTTIEQVNLVNW